MYLNNIFIYLIK